jgi:predicted MFS family arabinose efflux permease
VASFVTNSALDLPFNRHDHPIDYVGSGLLIAAVTCIVLVTTWGGTEYEWSSPEIIGLSLAGIVSMSLFVWQERRAPEPILPLRLFRDSIFTVSSAASFLVGLTMFGSIIFLPVFLQLVIGVSATNSGLLLLPLMVGIVAAAATSGRLITRIGRYKLFLVIGTAVMTIGMFLLSLMDAQTTRVTASIYMAVLGIGIGLVMQVLILAVQNSVPQRDLGIATSAASLFRSLGGAFGTAMFGAILRSRLDHFHPAAGTGWRERHRARLPRRQSTGYPRAPRSCSRRCDRGVRALDPFGLPMDGSPGGPRLRDRPGHEGEAPRDEAHVGETAAGRVGV